MPRENESIASSRAKVFLVPPNGRDPILMALVEDISATMNYNSENLAAIGEFVPPDNVVNNGQGQVRWGRVYRTNRATRQTLAPEVARFAEYERFDLLIIDPKDNKPLARARGILPSTLDLNVTNGRALRQNFNGICLEVQFGDEIREGAPLPQ